MNSFLIELFEYHHHYNSIYINLLEANKGSLPPELYNMMCHVVNAHNIWNCRILRCPHGKPNDLHTPEALRKMDMDNYFNSLDIIRSKEMGNRITYKNTKGEEFSNTIQDILFHVINHTTHHKAQISYGLRQNGIAPPVTDYIAYKRSRNSSA